MELTRRGFLKGSAAACGAAAAAGMFSTGGWLSPAKAYAGIGPAGAEASGGGNEHTACTYHQGSAGLAQLTHIAGGVLGMIFGFTWSRGKRAVR